MLPALPVEAISARGADMAGARRGTQSDATLPDEKPPPEKPTAGKKSRGARRSPAEPPAKGRAAKPGGPSSGRVPAKAEKAGGNGGAAVKAAELPVREGEHEWTSGELAEVRAALQEQIEALRSEIAASASQIAEGDSSDGAGDDQADAGAKTYEREHELALSYNSQDLLAQIERAVQRMDAGTYGICESCTTPIGKARLQVFPRATLCVTCKQREERR